MRLMNLESFPNREIRVTIVRSQVTPRTEQKNRTQNNEFAGGVSDSTCHSAKTRNSLRKPQPQGILGLEGKPGYGGLPRNQEFSCYARRQILRAGGALQKVANHEECLFLTVTLPGSTPEAMEAMARFSAFAVHRLKAWVNKFVPSKLDLYTWEWQKRGALHLHYVVHCPDRGVGEYIQRKLKGEWIRILNAISEASGVDMYRKNKGFTWASQKEATKVDAQWCKKSVAAYLSKYVSKGNKFQYCRGRQNYCPSRWYGVSRPLLQKLRELTFRVSLDSLRDCEGLASYEDCLSVLQSYAVKCYEYKHRVGDGKTIVAYTNENEQETIWNMTLANTRNTQDSLQNIEEKLRNSCQQGIYLMKRSKIWWSTFKQFCANSRPAHLIASPLSADITTSDLAYIMDMLLYTYRYTERTRCPLDGSSKLWYTKTMDLLALGESLGCTWTTGLLPRKD